MTPTNSFLQSVLEQVPRLLGQLNRNPSSRSYGSFDRAFWHYRTNDISGCRYQEAVLTLALLYLYDFPGNLYFQDRLILDWLRAALRFTASLQRGDGSFDEWYLNEGSYVGTAFLTVALGQTLLELKKAKINIPEFVLMKTTIARAAQWLKQAQESTVMNQVSGAVLALALAGEIIGDQLFKDSARKLVKYLLAEQNKEGWWREYGGPDIGYLSLLISYLAKYQRLGGDETLAEPLARAIKFLRLFVYSDGTAGGECFSRNTEYVIPSTALPFRGAIGPAELDDRYLCYILYNWLETGLKVINFWPEKLPTEEGIKIFSESKILRIVKSNYSLVINGAKGGSLRLDAGGKVYYDSGLEMKWGSRWFSSGIFDPQNKVDFGKNLMVISGWFKTIKEPLMKTPVALVFKLNQLLFGRFRLYQKLVKKFLRPRMISYRDSSTIGFQRHISFSDDKVEITDKVKAPLNLDQVRFGLKASYLAVPSSKYFTETEVAKNRLQPTVTSQPDSEKFVLVRSFSLPLTNEQK